MTPSHAPTSPTTDTAAHALADLLGALAGPAVVAGLVLLLGYAAVCAIRPYALCRRCRGTSRMLDRRGRPARRCRRCRNTGLRLRIGRRLYNRAARFHHARQHDRRTTGPDTGTPSRRDHEWWTR